MLRTALGEGRNDSEETFRQSNIPNGTNIESPSRMPEVEMEPTGGTAAIMWLSFAGSLPNSCAGSMTSAIPIRYGCAYWT